MAERTLPFSAALCASVLERVLRPACPPLLEAGAAVDGETAPRGRARLRATVLTAALGCGAPACGEAVVPTAGDAAEARAVDAASDAPWAPDDADRPWVVSPTGGCRWQRGRTRATAIDNTRGEFYFGAAVAAGRRVYAGVGHHDGTFDDVRIEALTLEGEPAIGGVSFGTSGRGLPPPGVAEHEGAVLACTPIGAQLLGADGTWRDWRTTDAGRQEVLCVEPMRSMRGFRLLASVRDALVVAESGPAGDLLEPPATFDGPAGGRYAALGDGTFMAVSAVARTAGAPSPLVVTTWSSRGMLLATTTLSSAPFAAFSRGEIASVGSTALLVWQAPDQLAAMPVEPAGPWGPPQRVSPGAISWLARPVTLAGGGVLVAFVRAASPDEVAVVELTPTGSPVGPALAVPLPGAGDPVLATTPDGALLLASAATSPRDRRAFATPLACR